MPKTYTQLTAANATAGNAILASDMNALFTNSNNYRVPPMCSVTNTAASYGTGSFQYLAANTEDFDTDGMHSTVTNNSRITPTTAGIYLFTACAQFPNVAGGTRQVGITVNRTSTIVQTDGPPEASGFQTTITVAGVWSMNGSTDYAEVRIYHSNTPNTAQNITLIRFQAMWLGQAS